MGLWMVCSEGVRWYLLEKIVEIDHSQMSGCANSYVSCKQGENICTYCTLTLLRPWHTWHLTPNYTLVKVKIIQKYCPASFALGKIF